MSITVTSEYTEYNDIYTSKQLQANEVQKEKGSEACWATFSPAHYRRVQLRKLILHDIKTESFKDGVLKEYFDAISDTYWNVDFDEEEKQVEIYIWDKSYYFPINTGAVLLWIGHMCRYPYLENRSHKRYVDYFADNSGSYQKRLLDMHSHKVSGIGTTNHSITANSIKKKHYEDSPKTFIKCLAGQQNIERFLKDGWSYENLLR
jgi:hypothetical protein